MAMMAGRIDDLGISGVFRLEFPLDLVEVVILTFFPLFKFIPPNDVIHWSVVDTSRTNYLLLCLVIDCQICHRSNLLLQYPPTN